ncbi:AmmeMemoRadiSam system protein B [bacterium]|nr:AmmeMemoRadiSam system protein B [bacterium]
MENIRKMSVAGIFYPANATKLKNDINDYISSSQKESSQPVKFLIVPHAGYVYSGKIAGEAFSEISGNRYKRVMLLGPSHRAYFENIAESEEDYWESPLGNVKTDFLNHKSIAKETKYHKNEHCLEVQLPFIKTILPNATITPLLISGRHSKAHQYAEILSLFETDDTLWVISSDFNHVGPNFQHFPSDFGFGSGESMDMQAIEHITSGDIKTFSTFLEKTSATICGALPILVAMHLVKLFNLSGFTFKKYDCSGNQTKDKNSVGYAALYC